MHIHALALLLAAAALTTGACDKPSPKKATGPSTTTGPSASAKGGTAPSGNATPSPGALTLPKAASNSELQASAPELIIDAARAITVAGNPAGTLPKPPPTAFKPGPIASLAAALTASRGDGRILNARIDASLTADAVWGAVQSAAKAGFSEVRLALDGGGALAIHMPAAASPSAPLPRAGHVAMYLTPAGVNAKVFIGASGEVFPVAGSAGGKPITNVARTCPAAPRKKGAIVPALIRSLGEPVCMANAKKDYWVAVSPTVGTPVQELVQLTAAMATPKAGCSPRIALAAPATDADMKRCGGALPTESVAAFVTANAKKAADYSAAIAASNRPFVKEVDLSKRPETLAPELAKKVAAKAGASANQAKVAVGRIATSDNDTSRDAVARAIARHLGDVKNCYAKHLKAKEADKPYSGALVMGVGISKDGKAMKPGFSRKGGPPDDLKLCVAAKAQSWTFDAPPGGKRIQAMVPIILRPPAAPGK